MPTYRRQATPEEALSLYREALLRGAPEAELERLARGLDPDIVATERWMLTAGRRARPQPDPLFARDLRRTLVQAAGTAEDTATPLRAPSQVWLDSRREAPPPFRPVEVPVEPPPVVAPRRWQWVQLTAAAVLLLLLVGTVVLVRQITFERPETQMAASGEPTVETLTDANLTGAASTWTPLAVERWKFLPGDATLTIPPIDGPQWIVADGGSVVATVDGNGQVLAPGMSLVIPAGQELQVRNSGLTETAIYRGVAATGFSLEDYDRDLITQEVALDTEAHEALPPGNSHIIFDRLTLPPGTTLQADAATGQDWFDIISGELGLTLIGDALPQGWTSGQERELTVDDPIPVLVPGTHITMHNIGNDPLSLLRLRVQPQGAPVSGEVTPATATP